MKKEVELIYNTIVHPAAFEIGCSGVLLIRRYEYPIWVVEWEEYNNTITNTILWESLEFDDPKKAAECFIELRNKCNVGLDKFVDSEDRFHMLGTELDNFKKKYFKEVFPP